MLRCTDTSLHGWGQSQAGLEKSIGLPWLGQALQEAVLVVKWTSARAKRARGTLVTLRSQCTVRYRYGDLLPR